MLPSASFFFCQLEAVTADSSSNDLIGWFSHGNRQMSILDKQQTLKRKKMGVWNG